MAASLKQKDNNSLEQRTECKGLMKNNVTFQCLFIDKIWRSITKTKTCSSFQ